jgi:1-acyl-sn-glycerol-3-phosphate acyltransferase
VRRTDPLQLAFTVGFGLFFLLTAPVACLIAAVIALVTLRSDPDRNLVHAFVSRVMFGYLKANPLWKVEVVGRERLPRGPAVLVANHQSASDILAAFGLFHPFKFVSKASLFQVPVIGWAMRLCRYVPVERGRPRSTHEMIEQCRGWIRRGMAVLIFPEGTYAPPGTRLPFKRGAFMLAQSERVPVVPVRIVGTETLLEGDGPWLSPRARVRVEVLEPIRPEDLGEDDVALTRRVETLLH